MKSILSASICAIALAAAVPAMAADETKPMHHHMHHKGKHSSMMGPHTKMKKAGDPSTEELNAKSLDAAKGGSDSSATSSPSSTSSSAPASGGTMAPGAATGPSMGPSTGTTSTAPGTGAMAPGATTPGGAMAPTTTPSNAPSGQ